MNEIERKASEQSEALIFLQVLNKPSQRIRNFPFEAAIWSIGLTILALLDPHSHHFSICPLANLGFDWCPGCGLGRSITYFFHGEIQQSLIMHPIGIMAVIILSFRIIHLTKTYLKDSWHA